MARDVHFLTDNAGGQAEYIFKKHHQAHPIELTLSLFNGDIALYPIDEYQASLQFEAYLEAGGEEETSGAVGGRGGREAGAREGEGSGGQV